MNDHEARQAVYAAQRRTVTGATTMPLRTYRVTLRDGSQFEERVIGLSQVAAAHPDAVTVEWVRDEMGSFW